MKIRGLWVISLVFGLGCEWESICGLGSEGTQVRWNCGDHIAHVHLLWKALVCHNSQQRELQGLENLYWLFCSFLLSLACHSICYFLVLCAIKQKTSKRTRTSKIPNSEDICFHIFALREKDCKSQIISDMILTIPVWLFVVLTRKRETFNWPKKKKPSKKASNLEGLPQNLDQATKDEMLVGWLAWFFSLMSVMLPLKSLFSQEAGLPLGERFGPKLFSQKRQRRLSELLSLEHVTLQGTWGRSSALRARPVGTAHHCQVALVLPEAKKMPETKKTGRFFCTCSRLGASPTKCSSSCGQHISWGDGLAGLSCFL